MKIKLQNAINQGSVSKTDEYIIASHYKDMPENVYRIIESHPTMTAATRARNILAYHDNRVGAIADNEDCRIFKVGECEII